jgi:hypothetical protein
MSEEQNNNEQQSRPREGSWKEVGQQFESLGISTAQAFRTAWSSIETKNDAQQVKSGLEAMAREVGKAIEETAKAPEGQKIKEEAKRTAESLRVAGTQTVEEARPQIASALKKVNEELQRLIAKLDEE